MSHKSMDDLSKPLLGQFAGRCFAVTKNWPLKAPSLLSRRRWKGRSCHLFGTFRVSLASPGRCARLFYSFLQPTLYDLLILQRKKPIHRH